MKAQLIKSSPGVGKTTAVAEAVHRRGVNTRIVTGSLRLARELAAEHGYVLVEGRHPGNCHRHDVVEALAQSGHSVEDLACGRSDKPRCPIRNDCAYWRQFEQAGPRVAAAEQLFNRNFLAGGRLLVVDDADLMRALVERIYISREDLVRAYKLLRGKRRTGLRRLLAILSHAALEVPCREDGGPVRLIGGHAWDQLARTARRYGFDIVTLIEALPKQTRLPKPTADEQGLVSRESVERAPPATLDTLFATLQDELGSFKAGDDFNSRLRLSLDGIEVWNLKHHVRSRIGEALLSQLDLLLLDATPVTTLVHHLTRDHERLPDIDVAIRKPQNVKVVQYAATTNGHTVLSNANKALQVRAEINSERLSLPLPPEKEGVICFRGMRAGLVSDGFAEEQVVTFGSVRGTNALADVERLHLVGRPMPSLQDLFFLAQVLHTNEPPVSGRMVLSPRVFGGQGYEVDVVDCIDPRVAELLRAAREDEMEQSIQRARIFTLEQPALLSKCIGSTRQQLRVVLHTSHPVPGLHVDELITNSESSQLNDRRREDAERRIRSAVLQLQKRCAPITTSGVAQLAGASRRTVAGYLRTGEHTLKSVPL